MSIFSYTCSFLVPHGTTWLLLCPSVAPHRDSSSSDCLNKLIYLLVGAKNTGPLLIDKLICWDSPHRHNPLRRSVTPRATSCVGRARRNTWSDRRSTFSSSSFLGNYHGFSCNNFHHGQIVALYCCRRLLFRCEKNKEKITIIYLGSNQCVLIIFGRFTKFYPKFQLTREFLT